MQSVSLESRDSLCPKLEPKLNPNAQSIWALHSPMPHELHLQGCESSLYKGVLRLEAPGKVQMEMREMRQGVLKVMEKSREEAQQQQQPWQQEVRCQTSQMHPSVLSSTCAVEASMDLHFILRCALCSFCIRSPLNMLWTPQADFTCQCGVTGHLLHMILLNCVGAGGSCNLLSRAIVTL